MSDPAYKVTCYADTYQSRNHVQKLELVFLFTLSLDGPFTLPNDIGLNENKQIYMDFSMVLCFETEAAHRKDLGMYPYGHIHNGIGLGVAVIQKKLRII